MPSPAVPPPTKKALALIFVIVFIDLLGFGIIIPILPNFAQRGFGASDTMVGLLVGIFSFMQFVFTPIWGRISDVIGRKPILVFGLMCSVAGYLMFGLANSLMVLFISRMLSGLGGANISAAQAYIADVTTPFNRAKGMGLIGMAFGLGFVFGPFMGGLLVAYGYEYPGFAAAGLSAISLVTTMIALPESHVHRAKKVTGISASLSGKALFTALRKPFMGPMLVLYFFIIFALANIFSTFPLLAARDYHLSDREIGYLYGYIGLIGAIVQGGGIRILLRFVSERKLFIIGNGIMMAGLVLIPYAGTIPLLLGALTLLSIGNGANNPTALSIISNHARNEEQGGVLGLTQSLSSLARVLGPVWGGWIFGAAGHAFPFLTGGAVMIIVLVASLRMAPENKNQKIPDQDESILENT